MSIRMHSQNVIGVFGVEVNRVADIDDDQERRAGFRGGE